MNKVGKQLEGQVLYKKQKEVMDYSDDIRIVATDIRTPENLASIFRVADAAGCKTIILVGDKSAYETKQFSRISRDAEKNLTIEKMTHQEFINSVKKYQPLVAVEITTKSENLFQLTLPDKCSFVIGNEKHGIAENILAVCQVAVHLPMFGVNGSMNVSHALGIALFEWRRQMSFIKDPSA